MPVALKVPSVGESITEVEIGEWLKAEGAFANENDPVVVIETEKATLEVPAPVSGSVSQILKQKGDKAAIGEVIGYMEEGSKASEKKKETAAAPPPQKPSEPPPQPQTPQTPPPSQPAQPTQQAQPPQPAQAAPAPTPPAPAPTPPPTQRGERIVPMTPIRRRIAERLVEAQKNAALLTTFNDIDMSAIADLRARHKEAFQQRHGVKLGIVSFFVRAVIESLKQIPQLNAEIRDTNIVYRDFYDIGIAVSAEKGLLVPVLRDADRLTIAEVEKAIAGFVERARTNQLTVDELQGGTFTISNGGIYGSLMSTPIVNPPQSGVLGLHAITDRAVVRNGQIVARPMMYVALTYDHRIVDGREAVTFLKHVKELIEDPALVLLGL